MPRRTGGGHACQVFISGQEFVWWRAAAIGSRRREVREIGIHVRIRWSPSIEVQVSGRRWNESQVPVVSRSTGRPTCTVVPVDDVSLIHFRNS